MRAVEKEKELPKFQFSTRPWNTRVFRQITSLFCQVGEQFTQQGDAVSRRKARHKAKGKGQEAKMLAKGTPPLAFTFAF
ncbi:MAG TPA: hypothetical protein VF591_08525 [Pyrinomonadaceae bacterium]